MSVPAKRGNGNGHDVDVLPSIRNIYERLNDILEKGIAFHERIWADDEEAVENFLKKYPESIRIKLASFALIASRILPSRAIIGHISTKTPGKRITVADLDEMHLPVKTIKRLAGIEDEEEE